MFKFSTMTSKVFTIQSLKVNVIKNLCMKLYEARSESILDTVAGSMKVEMTVDPEVTLATAVSAPPLPSSCPRDDTLHLTREGGK